MKDETLHLMIETQPAKQTGNLGAAFREALEKRQEKEREQAEYDLHELACNIAEDFDGGAIYAWRLDLIKECFRAGGTTKIDPDGELMLVDRNGKEW